MGETAADEGVSHSSRIGPTREEKFKILTSPEGEPYRIQSEKLRNLLRARIHRDPINKDPSAHATLLGHTAEVRSKPIAEIDHRRG